MACNSDDVSTDDILAMRNTVQRYINVPLQLVVDCTILIGIYIVFVHKRAQTKPWFVKVIWVFLGMACAINVSMRFVKKAALNNEDQQK